MPPLAFRLCQSQISVSLLKEPCLRFFAQLLQAFHSFSIYNILLTSHTPPSTAFSVSESNKEGPAPLLLEITVNLVDSLFAARRTVLGIASCKRTLVSSQQLWVPE